MTDTIHCSDHTASAIANLLQQSTEGNPLFVTQFFQGLYEDGHIHFDTETQHWHCDLETIQSAIINPNIVDFMVNRLTKLPEQTQELIKWAACIGFRFDLTMLAAIAQQSIEEVTACLLPALQQGFILSNDADTINRSDSTLTFHFLHDQVYQATYSLVPEAERVALHQKIGQRMLDTLSPQEQYDQLFDLLGHLNYGLSDHVNIQRQDLLLKLNIQAGDKAYESTFYDVAHYHFCLGIALIGEDGWQSDYPRTLALHEKAAEAAAIAGHFDKMDICCETVLQKATSLLDKIRVYQIRIEALIAQNQRPLAIDIAIDIAQQLGVNISLNPPSELVEEAIHKAKKSLEDCTIASLVRRPLNPNLEQLAIVQILTSAHSAIFFSAPQLLALEICIRTQICLQYGLSTEAAHTFADYGLLCAG